MRKLLLVLLLSLPVLALPTPEEVVTKLYRTHLKSHDVRTTISSLPRTFEPEFVSIYNQAVAKSQLNTDIFTHTQGTLTDFAVAPATLWTTRAEVRVKLWTGDHVGQQKSEPIDATVYLFDQETGQGYQVQDIQFMEKPRLRIRDYLMALAGIKPKPAEP
jgi:hypothetical protein